jgi:citrate lyase subunit beta/citryl-CoA lyase
LNNGDNVQSLYEIQSKRRLPVWRSIHFVPANVPRYIEKAASLEADAIQVDLEDSVPMSEKQLARENLRATVRAVKRGGADVIVRVNRPLSLAVRDIEAAVHQNVSALTMTKVDGPSHVRLMDELISECEQRENLEIGHTRLIVVIETPQAYEMMRGIASASPRVVAMMLGSEDFALECSSTPTDEVLLMPKQQMIIAARAAGAVPLGYIGTIANFRDIEAYRAMVRRSRQFGFEGGTSIHPSQIGVLNAEYGPQAEEVDHAKRVLDAYASALSEGRGSCQVDGRMVDVPVVERARRVLAKSEYLQKRAHPTGACAGHLSGL